MKFKTILILLILFQNHSFACTADFQEMLLANRQKTLNAVPIGMFYEKIRHWAKEFKAPKLSTNITNNINNMEFDDWSNRYYDNQRVYVESKYLTDKQLQIVNQAREAETLQHAKQILSSQKGTFVDYTLASITLVKGKSNIPNPYLSIAAPDLKVNNDPWRLWGVFMSGKVLFESGEFQQSLTSMNTVVNLVQQGLNDPLNVSSEAMIWQAKANMELGHYDKAIKALLRIQSSGDSNGSYWLRQFARDLVFTEDQFGWGSSSDEEIRYKKKEIAKAIQSPLARKLLITYAYTYLGEDYNSLLEALVNSNLKNIDSVDQLAAYAFRLGNYEDAAKLVQLSHSDLAEIIKAKLYIREGKLKQASNIYSKAIQNFKQQSFKQLSVEACTLIAESAVLTLSEGNIDEAFDLLINHTGGEYWQDITYIAEHLMPIDSLIKKVNSLPIPKLIKTRSPEDDHYQYGDYEEDVIYGINKKGKEVVGIISTPIKALHSLLARRLVRENRHIEAEKYFPEDTVRQRLSEYNLIQSNIANTTGIEKSQNLYRLSKWIMKYGWRVLAYEGYPDWYMFGINYTAWFWPPVMENGIENKYPLVHQNEWDALQQNKTLHNGDRYSYRYKAVELARHAANLLDFKDPNFENYLCHASNWAMSVDIGLGQEIFKEFIHKAKPTKDRKYFGAICNKVEVVEL